MAWLDCYNCQHHQVDSLATNKYTAPIPKEDVLNKSRAATSTRHECQQVHSISAYKSTAPIPKEMFSNNPGPPPTHSIGANKNTASTQTSPPHQNQNKMFFKHDGPPPVHSISSNQYMTSAPRSTHHLSSDVITPIMVLIQKRALLIAKRITIAIDTTTMSTQQNVTADATGAATATMLNIRGCNNAKTM